MRLPPAVWGPVFWHTIHITALAYPKDPSYAHKRAAKEFFEALAHLIPCPVCQEHYKEHMQRMPITPHLDRKEDLFKWTVTLHNAVNKSLGKPEYTEEESILFYRRLGIRGRTPVINQDFFDEVDIRSMVKGGFLGAGVVLAAGGLLWWASKGD